jgi:iron uptake system component EfeO
VTATDTTCDLSVTTGTAGPVTFQISNTGTKVNEFYLYGADGTTIVGEVENIGPGLSRELAVALEPGTYVTACKPGMTGEGIRAEFTVAAGSSATGTGGGNAQVERATADYANWVERQAAKLLVGTKAFARAVKDGDVPRAKALYPEVRMYWERIEPVAESFGDLDPKLDARINDLEPGQKFTGWHRLERDLWVTGLKKDSAGIADQMVADTQELVERVETVELTGDRITNGSKELLDEVATGKITGEEERYSHTDLYDFQANVEGAQRGYDALRAVIVERDPDLAEQLDTRFAAMNRLLAQYRSGDGFVSYDDLSKQDIRKLSAQLEALSEPVSQMTVVVLQ